MSPTLDSTKSWLYSSSRLALVLFVLACTAFVLPAIFTTSSAIGANPVGAGETLSLAIDPPEDAVVAVIFGTTEPIAPLDVSGGSTTLEISTAMAPDGTALKVEYYSHDGVLLATVTMTVTMTVD